MTWVLYHCRAADVSAEVRRQRPPRLLQADGVVKPYFFREAEGMEILRVGHSVTKTLLTTLQLGIQVTLELHTPVRNSSDT